MRTLIYKERVHLSDKITVTHADTCLERQFTHLPKKIQISVRHDACILHNRNTMSKPRDAEGHVRTLVEAGHFSSKFRKYSQIV